MTTDPTDQALRARRDQFTAQALDAIWKGTTWLTAQQLGEGARAWEAQGRIFAVRFDGQPRYPRYALDEQLQPLPVMARVIEAFGSDAQLRMASWLESRSSYLGGGRPRELLAEDPQQVLLALSDHQAGALHG